MDCRLSLFNPREKKPLIRWEIYQSQHATDDEINRWWATWPGANVGIITGEISGLVVIDLDTADAKDKLKELVSGYDFTTVPSTRTGKGWQLFFKHPGVTVSHRAGILPGIDVRGDGGYVVAPPSIHPNGQQYRWEILIDGELPELPEELLKLICPPAPAVGPGYREHFNTSQASAGVPEGQRDETIFKLACKLRHADMPQDMAESLILEAARNCQPPFSDKTALEKLERAYRKYEPNTEFDSAPKGINRAERNFELQTWGDFVATDHGSAPFTIEGIAPDCGLIAFHGRGKGGKTTLLIHAGRAIATGQAFLDRSIAQKAVVYLNYEMGFAYLKKLLIAGGSLPDEAYILNRPEPVLQTATIEYLMQRVGKPGVMVIDSFRGAFRLTGDAENSAGGAGVILRNVQDIAVKNKWLIIIVHHSNRESREGTDGVSGTSDWIAAPDVIWTWSRPDKAKPGVLSIERRLPPVTP